MSVFSNLYDECFPIKKITIDNTTPKKTWLTHGLIKCIMEKNRLYKLFQINSDNSAEAKYKTYKNKLTSLLRVTERTYYKNLLDYNKNNLSKTWKTLNIIINRHKNVHNNITFDINGKQISDSKDIADKFNKYFLNAPKELYKGFSVQSRDPKCYLKNKIRDSIYFHPTTENEVSIILADLRNSSAGYDNINIKAVKAVRDQIIKPLTHLCNLSLMNGENPEALKIARVAPIYKKNKKGSLGNYRPV